MSEIDIAEDEAHYRELDEAVERGDLRCDFTIRVQAHNKRIFSRPVAFLDKGWVLVQRQSSVEEIKHKVLTAIKNAEGIHGDCKVLDFSYALTPYVRP